jgi:hypothetical protein
MDPEVLPNAQGSQLAVALVGVSSGLRTNSKSGGWKNKTEHEAAGHVFAEKGLIA